MKFLSSCNEGQYLTSKYLQFVLYITNNFTFIRIMNKKFKKNYYFGHI